MKSTIKIIGWLQIMLLMLGLSSCSKDDTFDRTNEITLQSAELTLGSGGSTETLVFDVGADWSISSSADWCKAAVTHGAAGIQSLALQVDENQTYDQREATLTITCGSNSKTIKVVQVQKDAVVVAKNNYEFDCDAYPLTFQVNTNVNFQTTTDADWIKPYATTRALVTKEVSFAIDRNDAAVAREGYIIFQYGELMQKVRISQTAFETKMNITLVHSESTLDAPELMGDKASAVVDWGDGYTEDYSEYLKHTYTDGQASHNTVVKARSTNQVVLQSIGGISSLVIEYDE